MSFTRKITTMNSSKTIHFVDPQHTDARICTHNKCKVYKLKYEMKLVFNQIVNSHWLLLPLLRLFNCRQLLSIPTLYGFQSSSVVCPGHTGCMLKTADFTALSRSRDNLFSHTGGLQQNWMWPTLTPNSMLGLAVLQSYTSKLHPCSIYQ